MPNSLEHIVPPNLSGAQQRTYEAIFRHPVAHNLEWRDVHALLSALADVSEGHNGSLKVTRNGQTTFLHPSRQKEVASAEQIMEIRRFLERSSASSSPPSTDGEHLLVVIDHHEAKIYRNQLHGTVPQRIVPHDPHGFGRHLRTAKIEADGKRQPERKSYYEAIAKTLHGAAQILIFGSGTGASSAMDQLVAELKQAHSDIARHVVGTVVVDEHHLSEDQLLAKAREFYAQSSDRLHQS